MYDFLVQFLNPQFMIMVLSAVAVFATVASISMSALSGDR